MRARSADASARGRRVCCGVPSAQASAEVPGRPAAQHGATRRHLGGPYDLWYDGATGAPATLSRNAMSVAKGDILELLITFVTDDACWGTAGNLIGFVHHRAWSRERPIPESAVPVEGQKLTVKVIHVVQDGEDLPAWSTFGGKFKIDFAASVSAVAT